MRLARCPAVWFLLIVAVCVLSAAAQVQSPLGPANRTPPSVDPRNFDARRFGERIPLGPEWLFAAGDDPAWASPTFDDSGWKKIATDRPLSAYGIHDVAFAWYRIHIHLRPGTQNLMVATTDLSGRYETYANGVPIGGTNGMDGELMTGQDSLISFAVPDNLIERGDLVLAFRFRVNWGTSRGRGTSTPLFSDSIYLISSDSAPYFASYVQAHNAGPTFLLCGLSLLASSISLALFFALRGQQEYLAIGIYLLCSSGVAAILLWTTLGQSTYPTFFAMFIVLGIEAFTLIEFVRQVLQLPRTRWLLALEIVVPLAFLVFPLHSLGLVSHSIFFLGFFLPVLVMKIFLPLLLFSAWRRGNREAGLLLPAILIGGLADYWQFVLDLVSYFHLETVLPALPFSVTLGSYRIDFYRICDFIFDFAILFFLVQRTVRIARERSLAAAELEAARTVQKVLIPEEIPTIPGFVLQSTYKPAGHVGGDFFQILPTKTGGVLVVIGDVSGKGMPAAMTVSLLVGTVRTLAHYTQSPGQILAAMNTRMLARSSGGFTTCLVLRADTDGSLTIANAGHISPYLAGKELPLENGLPLGLAAETSYPEAVFQLIPGEQITLLSDGVIEARDKAGALFGFDRAAAITGQSADQIAHAAELFGQEDDITALTLARTA
jgi:hypothetical protein